MASGLPTQYMNPCGQGNQGYGDSDSDRDQSKPVRACQRCRASKVRCIQSDDSRPCVRCEKAGATCLPTGASNKRQKRTDVRSIGELEASLAALTSTLYRRSQDTSDWIGVATPARMMTVASQSTAAAVPETGSSTEASSASIVPSHPLKLDGIAPSGPTHSLLDTASGGTSAPQIEAMIGVIIDDDIACSVFEEFTTNMLPEFPFVAFPQNTSARDVWKNAPITFLAILDVAADGFCELETSRKLRKVLVQVYATCLLGTCTYNLPLLRALIISAVWLRAIEPTQPGEQMDVYQLSHAAANMAIIMGLGKSLKAQTWSGPMPTQARRLRGPASQYQTSSLDSRRIWLGCHYICSNTSMALQTPNIMRWTRYMDECLEVLETSPARLASDRVLCLHSRLQHILEDFELQLSSSITGSTAARVTHRAFKRQLATWASTPRVWNDPLRFSEQFVALYMHEIAMYSAPSVNHPPGSSNSDGANIGPAEFTECLAAAHSLLDVFLSLDMSLIRALPTLYFVRLTYAGIVLVKLHFAAVRLPDTEDAAQKTLGLKVDEYLGRMLQKFSRWGTLWPAWRLTKSLRRLRNLFRQCSNSEMMASELAWLNLWRFEKTSVDVNISDETVPAEQTNSAKLTTGTRNIEKSRLGASEAHSLEATERLAPAPQTFALPGWDLLNLNPCNSMPLAVDDTLSSMSFGDTSLWDDLHLDKWLDSNMHTSTFDFDGDLQSTIQYME